MGIMPNHWGPYVWGAIHLICLGAPSALTPSQQHVYQAFFELLPGVFPCASCAKHLAENLQKVPIADSLDSNSSLFAWSVRLHNVVNEQLGKPVVTLEQARRHWDSICNGEKDEKNISHGCSNTPKDSRLIKMIVIAVVLFIFGFALGYAVTTFSKGRRGR